MDDDVLKLHSQRQQPPTVGGNIVTMKSAVFNNTICSPFDFAYPNLTKDSQREILAGLFEQLMLFDSITISTNRLNYSLIFLINQIGINKVEEFIERDYIKFLIWSPIIVTASGNQLENGTIDESVIYGKPPIVAGSLVDSDFDPENNIDKALSVFNIHRDRKRSFKRIALKNYIVPDGMEFSSNSAKVIINAYKENNLSELGLPYIKEPEQLNLEERQKLLSLGHNLLETAILSKYGLKSYNNYEHYKICEQNLKNIGKAYAISENVTSLLHYENLPDLKSLFLKENLTFESVSKLRYKSNSKHFRKWLNSLNEDANACEITEEYINEIKGSNNFFETNEGKFLKNLTFFGVNSILGNVVAGPAGSAIGFGLGLFESFWLDSILKGKNPSMFIDDLKEEIKEKE